MKKLIPILLSLVLILSLLPAYACANYQDGDSCPNGCDSKLIVKESSKHPELHECYCPNCDFKALEEHWGGEASCESGPICKGCGKEYGDPLGHKYERWEGHETITRMYFRCTKCGANYWEHNSETWNMKWNFVRYANGEHVKYYKAYCTGPDYNGVLTVLPLYESERDDTDEIGLYMSPDDVYVWVWENINRIELVRDDATLALDPREITPEIFGLKEAQALDFYIFSLTPAEDGAWLVKAEAMTGDERIPTQEQLKGLTLTVAGKEIEIPENGVYKPE